MIGRLDLDDEPALEARAQPLLEPLDRLGRVHAREDDLPPVVEQAVEDVEELFLRALLPRALVDVVENERVDHAIARAPLLDLLFLQRLDELIDELRRVHHRDGERAAALPHELVAERVQQMRLPHALRTVHEERIVLLPRLIDDRVDGVHRELIRGADFELRAQQRGIGTRRRLRAADEAREHELRLAHALRILEQLRRRELRVDLGRFRLELAQPPDRSLESREQRVDVRLLRCFERALEQQRDVAELVPVRHRLDDAHAPAVDVLRDDLAQIRQKARELLSARLRRHEQRRVGLLAEQLAHAARSDRRLLERLARDQSIERALQLAHVRELDARDLIEHARLEHDAALLALAAQNRDTRLVVRRADVHDEPARESRDQPLVEIRDLRRRAIAREHDLLPRALQRVEEAQHLALRLLAPGEELHVVEQQHVDHVEAPLEELHRAVADRVVELLDELLERHVLHRRAAD